MKKIGPMENFRGNAWGFFTGDHACACIIVTVLKYEKMGDFIEYKR
jgi:hypothetical protein